MESQEDALYDAKDQHQQRNAEFLDIKKGTLLTRSTRLNTSLKAYRKA